MKSITYIKCLFGAAILVVACSKTDSDESYFDTDAVPITFSTSKAQLSVESKASGVVAQGETDFGSYSVSACDRGGATTRVNSSGFEENDQIGVYLYYNYYFAMYGDSPAESVILNDAVLTVGSSGNSLSPQRLWTFSSLGGDAPNALLAYAYYPKSANVQYTDANLNPPSRLLWDYDSATDLLIASEHYYKQLYVDDDYTGTDVGVKFKEYVTESRAGTIDLLFKHQLATLSFYVYRAADVDALTVKSLTVKYLCAATYDSSATPSPWSGDTISNTVTLTVSGGGALGTTAPTDPMSFNEDMFLPPNTEITSILFAFDGTDVTYTWHPHIADMAVKNYQIIFELDPVRAN